MKYFIDIAFDSLNKFGEELCGDKVEIIRNENSIIIVLADGLGSGVKANILSTLTSKIAATMLKQGANLYETVDTIVHTLPVCNIRKVAYSTFSIFQIYEDGTVYAVEYDNPPYFIIRDNETLRIDKKESIIDDKLIAESKFELKNGDSIILVSDGVVHAGIGSTMKLGWQWDMVERYVKFMAARETCARKVCDNILGVCNKMYRDKPGDDTTVIAIKVKEQEVIDLFTGPPKDQSNDEKIVKCLMSGKGKKVVCGGTAARIVERVLGEKIEVDISTMTKELPPIARINGVDLVTEGVLTLCKVVEKINTYNDSFYMYDKEAIYEMKDGASRITKLLLESCTELNLWVGKAINPAHQNPDLPMDLSIKLKVVEELANELIKLGKKVNITYI